MTDTKMIHAQLDGPVGGFARVGPWFLRSRSEHGRRAALEVYEHGELIDVLVESRLRDGLLLRGARRHDDCGPGGAGRLVSAWGRLPTAGVRPEVAFLRRGPLQRPVPVELVTVAGQFWFAFAEGVFRGVRLRPAAGGPVERLRAGRTA